MIKRKNQHKCDKMPTKYAIRYSENKPVLMDISGDPCGNILGMIHVNYCPWCGERFNDS